MIYQLSDLYDRIYQDESTKDPRTFINRIEGNEDLIEKLDYTDYDDYKKATRLLADYGIMLFIAGYLQKALKYINIAIDQLEKDKVINKLDLLNEPLYEALIFHRGMTYYNLKEYKKAKIDFVRLNNKFPDNDRYNNWMRGINAQKITKIEWGFAIISMIFIFLSMYFKPEDGIIDKLSLYGIFVGLIGGLLSNFWRRKIAKTNNYTA